VLQLPALEHHQPGSVRYLQLDNTAFCTALQNVDQMAEHPPVAGKRGEQDLKGDAVEGVNRCVLTAAELVEDSLCVITCYLSKLLGVWLRCTSCLASAITGATSGSTK